MMESARSKYISLIIETGSKIREDKYAVEAHIFQREKGKTPNINPKTGNREQNRTETENRN